MDSGGLYMTCDTWLERDQTPLQNSLYFVLVRPDCQEYCLESVEGVAYDCCINFLHLSVSEI